MFATWTVTRLRVMAIERRPYWKKTSKITFSGFRKFLRKDSFKFVLFYISDLKKLSKLTKNGLNFKHLPSSTHFLITSCSDEHF